MKRLPLYLALLGTLISGCGDNYTVRGRIVGDNVSQNLREEWMYSAAFDTSLDNQEDEIYHFVGSKEEILELRSRMNPGFADNPRTPVKIDPRTDRLMPGSLDEILKPNQIKKIKRRRVIM